MASTIPSRISQRCSATVWKGFLQILISIPLVIIGRAQAQAPSPMGTAANVAEKACLGSCLSKAVCGGRTEESCCIKFCEYDGLWQSRFEEKDPALRIRGLCESIVSYRLAVSLHSQKSKFIPPTLSIKIGILKAALGFPNEAQLDWNSANTIINGDRPADRELRDQLGFSDSAIALRHQTSLTRLRTAIAQAQTAGPPPAGGSREHCTVVLASNRVGSTAAPARLAVSKRGAEKPPSPRDPEASNDVARESRLSPGGQTSMPAGRSDASTPQHLVTPTRTSPASADRPTEPQRATAPNPPPALGIASSLSPGAAVTLQPCPTGTQAGSPATPGHPARCVAISQALNPPASQPLAPSLEPARIPAAKAPPTGRRCGTGCGIALGVGGSIAVAATLVGLVFAGKAIELSRASTLFTSDSSGAPTLLGATADNQSQR